MMFVMRWVGATAVLASMACGQTTILPGGCIPGNGGMPRPGRTVIPPQNTYGIGRSSVPRINMIHQGWTERYDPVVFYPRPCPQPRPRPTPLPDRPLPRAERPVPRNDGVVVGIGSSGVRVAGSYTGEKWNVAFGLNTGLYGYGHGTYSRADSCWDPCSPTYPQQSWWQPVNSYYPYGGYYYGYGSYGWPYYGSIWNWGVSPATYYFDGALDPQLLNTPMPMNQAPAAAPTEPPPPRTAYDKGIDSLRAGDSFRAAAELRLYLREHPTDARVMRVLAIALIQEKDLDTAASMMRMAYRTDPKLAGEPLAYYELGLTDREFRALLTRAVTRAHSAKSGSAWLLVASMMQAEGRRTNALEMLQRANKLGLEQGVYDSLNAELSR